MRILSIDAASHEGHMACVEGNTLLSIRLVERIADDAYVPLARAALNDAGWNMKNIECVACNLGPGGFTSVRGGVTFANALADELGAERMGYHGSELALARAPADLWIHSTRRDQVFVQGGMWTEPTLILLSELSALQKTVAGDLLDEHRAVLAKGGASFPPLQNLNAVLPPFLSNLHTQETSLLPWYGRGI